MGACRGTSILLPRIYIYHTSIRTCARSSTYASSRVENIQNASSRYITTTTRYHTVDELLISHLYAKGSVAHWLSVLVYDRRPVACYCVNKRSHWKEKISRPRMRSVYTFSGSKTYRNNKKLRVCVNYYVILCAVSFIKCF